MTFKKTLAAASIAAASFATGAYAATDYGGFTYTPSNSPFNLKLFELSVDGTGTTTPGDNNDLNDGTSLGGNLVNNSASAAGSTSAGGHIAFKFTNKYTGALVAVNFSTTNPLTPYDDLRISWCDDVACTTEYSFVTEPLDDVPLTTTFTSTDEMQFLVATWTSVSGSNSDIDFDVVTTVPLPAGMLLMGTALAGLGVMRRRKNRAA